MLPCVYRILYPANSGHSVERFRLKVIRPLWAWDRLIFFDLIAWRLKAAYGLTGLDLPDRLATGWAVVSLAAFRYRQLGRNVQSAWVHSVLQLGFHLPIPTAHLRCMMFGRVCVCVCVWVRVQHLAGEPTDSHICTIRLHDVPRKRKYDDI